MNQRLEFAIELPLRGSRQRLHALHGQLRAAIMDGRLKPEQQLPSTRELAVELGASRNTVVAAYDLLLSEGYLVARRGTGNFVAGVPAPRAASPLVAIEGGDRRLNPMWREAALRKPSDTRSAVRYDFSLGVPDAARFPFEDWRRLSARALRAFSRMPAAYEAPAGRVALRTAIAGHISFARAVACQPDDIVVTSGAQQAFDLLARVLVTPGRTVVAVEDPGYPHLRTAFEAAGAKVVAVPVDAEGLVVERLPAEVRVIYVTPSHQFPLGSVMSPRRRAALLAFARKHHAVVIEDDYDGEFRYGGRPLDALQTLDRDGSVFYVGTFSKSLFPALRLGYVVAPPWALAALMAVRQLSDWHSDVLAQDTLAMFIAEGHLARHVRKMRKIYAERRTLLLDALARHAGDTLQPIPSDAGLHLAALLTVPVEAQVVVKQAVAVGIRLEALDAYAIGRAAPNGVAFGLGMVPVAHMEQAIRTLGRLLDEYRRDG